MTLPTVTPPSGDAGQQDPPFPPAPIEELLRLFVKAVRAHQLYLPNNPVYRSAIDAVRRAFGPIWQQTDELLLALTETEIKWYDRVLLVEPTKSADSLPWTFFKDGIREIQFAKGFEEEELVRLFEILQRLRKAAAEEDDLLTMIWEGDFAYFRYRYVDVGAEPVTPLEENEEQVAPKQPDDVRAAVKQVADQPKNAVVNMEDFDASLYFLDEREMDYLRHEIELEYKRDLRQNVAAMLFDIYEAQAVPGVREEISDIIEALMVRMLSAGQLRMVAYLLAESQVAVERGKDVLPAQAERAGQLPDRLSAPDALGQLIQALDLSADTPAQQALTELFEQLRPAALETVFAWLPKLQNERIRPALDAAAERLAAAHPTQLIQLIGSTDAAVAGEAIRRSGAMKLAAAVAPLARVLGDADPRRRQSAVQALTEIGSAGALQVLERSIEDTDRDIRIAVIRALSSKAYRGVFARLESVVKGKDIAKKDLTERMALFEAYGSMCGDGGVPFLDDLLNAKSMFGKREDGELRACAAMALGRVGTKKAQEALQRAGTEKDVVVRNAVNRASRTMQRIDD